MKNNIIILALSLFLSGWECSHSKKTQQEETKTPPVAETQDPVGGTGSSRGMSVAVDTSKPATIVKADEYRLLVSFVSHGEGTDGEALAKYDNHLRNLQKKVSFEMYNWGREGEVDYCIRLSELNAQEQKEFVSNTKELLKDCKLVNVYENVICRNKK